MAEIKVVADTEIAAKPKVRRVSDTPFPYYNLVQSVDVAKIMHEKAGGSCNRSQLAALLNYKGVRNGSFLTRVAAAKMFGLVEQEDDQLRITQRGKALVAPVTKADEDRAMAAAFLDVPLFKRVYDEFNGHPLPPEVGLKNFLLSSLGIIPDRAAPTVKILLDSAEHAGFFRTAGNRSRLIVPLSSGGASEAPLQAFGNGSDEQPPPAESGGGGQGGSGGNGGGSTNTFPNIHPAILGLLSELPKAGTALTEKKRKSLVAAFTATVGFIYPDADDVP